MVRRLGFLVVVALLGSSAPVEFGAEGGDVSLVEDVVKQLRLRGQGTAIRTFAKQQDLTVPRSNSDLMAMLHTSIKAGRIKEDDLTYFFFEQIMFCNKRVYVLKETLKNPSSLGAAGWHGSSIASLHPHVGAKAKRPAFAADAPRLPGSYAGTMSFSGKAAHLYVTARTVEEAEELPEDQLIPSARSALAGQRFKREKDIPIQCFDVILEVGGRTLLLVDSPPRIDAETLKSDIGDYRFRLNPDASAFVDLWAAVGGIYNTKSEGLITSVKFMSNQRSNHIGSLGKGNITDFRKLPYHAAGSAAAAVNVYAIGVRWLNRNIEAFASLPATARHLTRQQESEGGAFYPALEYFETPVPMTRAGFEFAATRIIAHS